MAKRNIPDKKKKEKVIYYDDNSTSADMSQVRRKGEQALNYICNVEYSKSKRKARITAINKRRKDNA